MQEERNPLFPWEMLNTVVGGVSAIDVPRLHLVTPADAEDFLECYGFTFSNPTDRTEMERIRLEAITFINQELLVDENHLVLPPQLVAEEDLRQVLLWASGDSTTQIQRWSCSLLRVMHTLVHCHAHFNERYGDEILSQILARFEPHIHETDDGLVLGEGVQAVPLAKFEVKHGKALHSLAIKLMQKAENVATDIFDRVGVRFVTKRRFDALLVVRYLRVANLIMFANIKPSRSRNTLINLSRFRSELEELDDSVLGDRDRMEELRERVESASFPGPPQPGINPHSASEYHAIQFTCRQQIRVDDHSVRSIEKTLGALRKEHPESNSLITQLMRTLKPQKEIRFFFPFEVQVLDEETYRMTRTGRAAHDVYKARQRRTVKKRVLRSLWNEGVTSGFKPVV